MYFGRIKANIICMLILIYGILKASIIVIEQVLLPIFGTDFLIWLQTYNLIAILGVASTILIFYVIAEIMYVLLFSLNSLVKNKPL